MYFNDFNTDLETLGEIDSYHDIGPSWASAAVGPLAWYKFFASEGGMRVPLVIGGNVNGQSVIENVGSVAHALTWITDLTPTILQIAGVGSATEGIVGKSLAPLFADEQASVRSAEDIVGYELGGNKALFKGDYKLVMNRIVNEESVWQLFNIVLDPGETEDLKSKNPQLFAELNADYEAWAVQQGVIEVKPDYDQRAQVFYKGLNDRPVLLLYAAGALLGALSLLVLPIWLLIRRFRKNRR